MSVRTSIDHALSDVVRSTDGLVVLHSSLIHLGLTTPRLKWEVLGCLKRHVERGQTIAVPAFTFSFCTGQPFDAVRSRSETGVVGDWVRQSAAAIRTPHPIYSFAVMGPRAEELMVCANSTTFGYDSIFALFERLDARIVMLGCDWSYCTQFHRYEEEARVPYRHYKTFRGRADFGRGPVETEASMFVRDRVADAWNDFEPAVQRAREAGAIAACALGHGRVEAASAATLASISRELLAADPYVFVKDGRRVGHVIAQTEAARANPPLRIAVLSDANIDLLRDQIARDTAAWVRGRHIEMARVPFGQMQQQILDEESDLHRFRPDLAFFVDRPQEVLRVPTLDAELDEPTAYARVDEHADLIGRLAAGGVRHVFVMGLLLGAASPAAPLKGSSPRAGHLLPAADQRLRERLTRWPHVHVFDPGSVGAVGAAFDERLWLLGRIPFADAFSRAIAVRCSGLALAALEQTVRVLILDLDNTLWGGVLGEDGLEGVALGGDFPGNAYRAFQAQLLSIRQRGVALAISSKNDEAEAIGAIRGLDAMLIKEEDLAAWRINWRPKWRNVEEIAAQLGLGLDNVGVIDDNPLERELIRANLPDVKVLDLPGDPAGFIDALRFWPPLAAIEATAEDATRARRYADARKRLEEFRSFDNPTAYLMSLGSRLHIARLTPANQSRCVQLLNKTNQFNTTTRRYGARDLGAIEAEGALVAVLGLEDLRAELENIGVLIVRWNHPGQGVAFIDDFLLSCRVLGRGIETAVLAWIAREARRRCMRVVRGLVVDTERNTPVRSVFRDHGFVAEDASGIWCLDLENQSPPGVPPWLTIVDEITAEAVA